MEMYLVGGCIRDELLGLKSKDVDFTVVLDPAEMQVGAGGMDPFRLMALNLKAMGFEIFLETPEYFTIRARFPKTGTFGSIHVSPALHGITADFVLARKEGSYSDGRRPDTVQVGTLQDDLARRDFTMNAIAKDAQGNLIDPFGGRQDIANGRIVCVRDPHDRIIKEDALRGVRALRFSVTKKFVIAPSIEDVLRSLEFRVALRNTAIERVQDELNKMFQCDTLMTLELINKFNLGAVLFFDTGLRLMPTMKG